MKISSYVFIFVAIIFIRGLNTTDDDDYTWDEDWDWPYCCCQKPADCDCLGYKYYYECKERPIYSNGDDCEEPPRTRMFNPVTDPLVLFFKQLVSCCFIDGVKYVPQWKNCSIVKFIETCNASSDKVAAMSIGPEYTMGCGNNNYTKDCGNKTKYFERTNPNKTNDCVPCNSCNSYPNYFASNFASHYCNNCQAAAKYCTSSDEQSSQLFQCIFGIYPFF